MKEYPLITKKEVKKNSLVKKIQKRVQKKHRHIKGRFPKAQISKLVELRPKNNFYDFTNRKATLQVLEDLNKDVILSVIREAGILGLSGSGFPTAQKIKAVSEAKTEEKYLIINAVACDPGLLHDDWLIKNYLPEIEKGIQILSDCISFSQIILATKEEVLPKERNYKVYTVPDRYPMGAENVLIKEVLGEDLAQYEIPADRGILVLNAQTVYVIYEALYKKYLATTKCLTVADMTTGEAVVARVNVGDSVIEVLHKIMGERQDVTPFFGGGLMMARSATKHDKISAKTNFIAYAKEIKYSNEAKCRRCGECTRKCPMKIKVHKIIQAVEKNKIGQVKALKPQSCIQCGACTYHCKAGKNVMELIAKINE